MLETQRQRNELFVVGLFLISWGTIGYFLWHRYTVEPFLLGVGKFEHFTAFLGVPLTTYLGVLGTLCCFVALAAEN